MEYPRPGFVCSFMSCELTSAADPVSAPKRRKSGATAPELLPAFKETLREKGLSLRRGEPRVLQLNVGKLCNLTCTHCHVNAGPGRKEIIKRETLERILAWLEGSGIRSVDLTGGAPEMIPDFYWLVAQLKRQGYHVIDRCNLTILVEAGFDGLAEFLAEHEVEVVASMPCYSPENVNAQRGEGVFDRSIEALRKLNALGYGIQAHLRLNLVYNPNGAKLPPNEETLQADYRRELRTHFGIEFNQLFALANLPVARFASWLKRNGQLEDYMQLLLESFNPGSVAGLMCRDTLSVDWQGRVFDCDFNQQLALHLGHAGKPLDLWELDLKDWKQLPIRTGNHCYGCTAGQGSSCGGAVTQGIV